MKRFDASIEWLRDRIALRDEEMEMIRQNGEVEADGKAQIQPKAVGFQINVCWDYLLFLKNHVFSFWFPGGFR